MRDRLLAGMLLVALLPLGAFAALVSVELGAISRSTAEETHRAVLEDAEARQRGEVADRARVLDIRLGTLAGEVRHLGDQMRATLALPPSASNDPPFIPFEGVRYSGSDHDPSSLIVGQSSRNSADPIIRARRIGAASGALQPFMASMRQTYPEIEAVWVVDTVDSVIRTVPGMDVPLAVTGHRLDSAAPLGPDGQTIFSTSQRRFAAAGDDPAVWSDPSRPIARGQGPFWTDPYSTRNLGGEGVTVWLPLGDGRTLVGADVRVDTVTQVAFGQPISTAVGAYPMLLSSSNKLLGGGPEVARDFRLGPAAVGELLPRTGDSRFDTQLDDIEKTGHSRPLRSSFRKVSRELFTAPIYTAHWVLVTSVPVADLEPDVGALSRGVDSGIRRLAVLGLPIALLLVALAFTVATVIARRLTGPIDALRSSAEQLALGHTDRAIPPQGEDEVGQLAASLERMRKEINFSRDAILDAAKELEVRVAERTGELRSRNDELVALNALARTLTRSLDPTVILGGALETLRAVLPVDCGRGYSVDEKDHGLVAAAQAGSALGPVVDEGLDRIARAAIDEGRLVNRTVAGGELVGMPLGPPDAPLGALSLLAGSATAVRVRETLIDAVADQAGLALRTARLSLEGRDTAVLEERTRLAREIHDTLAQQLTGIVIQLQAAEGLIGGEVRDSRAREALVVAGEGARAALQEARRSVWNLRPEPLTATGLVAAIQLEVDRWSARSAIAGRFRSDGVSAQLPLQPQAEVALLRIVQEALYNVAKHSGASHVSVRLRRVGDEVELSVRDDGGGFDCAGEIRPGSFGITGMRERAHLAGGRFAVESSGRGTRVTVHVPLHEPSRHLVPA